MAPVAYAGLENLTLNAASRNYYGFGRSYILVKGTSAATTINGGDTRDYVTVGNDRHSLDDIRGPLTVVADTYWDWDLLTLDDQGETQANSYTVTPTGVARSGAAPISYDVPEASFYGAGLSLRAGDGNDTVVVTGTTGATPVGLSLGGGDDTVTLAGDSSLPEGGFYSQVGISGGAGTDAIVVQNVDSGGAPAGMNYTIRSTWAGRDGSWGFNYATVESLTVIAGAGDDVIQVQSTLATTPVVVRAGPGNDTLIVGGTDASALAGAVTLDGQGGTDTLDYSAHTAAVRVNLALGTATGALGGVRNFENVSGGQGDDILVGDDRANVLRGGSGRDVLVGRGGADQLFGEAGDDLLIGGSTAHDLAAARLEDLMREWARTDLLGTPEQLYRVRIDHLLGALPGGLNGTTTLGLGQVIDDGAADSLDGGSELDWFFLSGGDASLLDPGERVN